MQLLSESEVVEVAAGLRRLLADIEAGDLAAGPAARAYLRGASDVLEELVSRQD